MYSLERDGGLDLCMINLEICMINLEICMINLERAGGLDLCMFSLERAGGLYISVKPRIKAVKEWRFNTYMF